MFKSGTFESVGFFFVENFSVKNHYFMKKAL